MRPPRTPLRPAWRPPVVATRDVWCALLDLHAGQRRRRVLRWLARRLVVVSLAVALLLTVCPLLVLWAMA